MGLNITRADVDKLRATLKRYEPFELDDPVLDEYDTKADINRLYSTNCKKALIRLGLDPYDDKDYGDLINDEQAK